MRILVDYRPALRARTGVGEYIHELVRAYTAQFADPVAIFSSSWKDRPARDVAQALRSCVIDRRIPVHALNFLWHRLEWPPVEALTGPVDVAHAAHPLLLPSRTAAQVITIHDLFFLSHRNQTRREIRRDYAALAPHHARRADAIVTSSNHVKRLIVEQLMVAHERVYVCPPGAPTWATLGRGAHVPGSGYVLFVGTMEPRKNIGVLLDAFERLAQRVPAARLVLAGTATADAAAWLDRLRRAPLKERATHLGYVPIEQREQLYAGARVVVIPSLDEGFGLPALEAMSAGIPVIASNRGSLPEVIGTAGTLLDAGDAGAWADALEHLLTNEARAAEHGHAGLERAKAFSWTSTAATLRRAYVDAVERRRRRNTGD